MNFWPSWREHKAYALLVILLLTGLIGFLGVKIDNTLKASKEIGKPQPFEHQIYVEGEGRVTGKPDIANLTLMVDTKGDTVPAAQEQNTTTVNALIEKLKEMEIAEDDISTASYNVYENYEWNEELQTSELKGWIVSQQLKVKVRDTNKVGDVLAMSGQNGITSISGPEFAIDDLTNLKAEARDKALEDATEKAGALAQKLGVELKAVVGFSEWFEQPYSPTPYYADMALAEASKPPSILTGTTEVIMHVTVTYVLAE